MANTNITLENLLELAQAATSIGDGDYIFIYKAGANGFSKIEKNVFFQGIAASAGGGMSEDVYDAIQTNVETLRSILYALTKTWLANLAFTNGRPSDTLLASIASQFTWPDNEGGSSGGDTPTGDPSLTVYVDGVAVANGGTINVGTNTGNGVSKTITIKGSNLTSAVSLSMGASTSGLSVSPTSIDASQVTASSGATATISYSGNIASASGSLTISSGTASVTLNLTASYQEQGGETSYQVSAGTLSHVQITETLPATVSSGGSFTGHLVADSGYSLPSSIAVSGTHGTVSYDSSTGVFTIPNITSNVAISATAVPSGQQNDYVQDGLVFHLDGQNQGSETGKWIDSVGLKEFVLSGNYELISGKGIKFLDAGDGNSAGYGEYSGDPLYATVDGAIDYNTFNKWTIEVVMTTNQNFSAQYTHGFFSQKSRIDGVGTCPISAALQYLNGNNYMVFGQSSVSSTYKSKRPISGSVFDPLSFVRISQNAERMVVNGVTSTAETEYFRQDAVTYDMRVGTSVAGSVFTANATIHEVRIYNRLLTELEMLQNQQVDSQRYGGN